MMIPMGGVRYYSKKLLVLAFYCCGIFYLSQMASTHHDLLLLLEPSSAAGKLAYAKEESDSLGRPVFIGVYQFSVGSKPHLLIETFREAHVPENVNVVYATSDPSINAMADRVTVRALWWRILALYGSLLTLVGLAAWQAWSLGSSLRAQGGTRMD